MKEYQIESSACRLQIKLSAAAFIRKNPNSNNEMDCLSVYRLQSNKSSSTIRTNPAGQTNNNSFKYPF